MARGGRLPAALAGLAFLAGLPLLILPPRHLVLSRWMMDPLPPVALTLQSDALSTPFLLIILLVTAVGCSIFNLPLPIDSSKSEKRLSAAWLLLAVAGGAFVLAGDPLTLYVAWVLVDLAIFAVVYSQTAQTDLDQPIRALGINTVLGLPLLMAAVTVVPGVGWAHVSGQPWPALAIAAMLVAAGARLEVYPAPFRFPGELGGTPGRPFLELVSVTCGAYLALRSLLLAGGALPLGALWGWLAIPAIAVAGFLAWWGDAPAPGPISATARLTRERAGTSEDQAQAAVNWITVVQAGLFLLAAGWPGLPRAVAVLQGFTLCLAPALLRLWLALGSGPATRRGLLWVRSLGWLAVANLLGVPPTLGFVARWALYRHLLEGGAWHLLILLSAATALTVPPLLRLMRAERRAGRVSSAPIDFSASAQVAGVSLIGVVLLLIGLQPLLLLAPLQMLMSTASIYLEQLVRGVSSAVGLAILLALLLPVLAGYGLTTGEVAAWLPPRQYPGDAQRLKQQVQTALSLEWTYRAVEQGAWRLGTMVRTLLAPLEGEWYWGWAFLFALLMALLLLSG